MLADLTGVRATAQEVIPEMGSGLVSDPRAQRSIPAACRITRSDSPEIRSPQGTTSLKLIAMPCYQAPSL